MCGCVFRLPLSPGSIEDIHTDTQIECVYVRVYIVREFSGQYCIFNNFASFEQEGAERVLRECVSSSSSVLLRSVFSTRTLEGNICHIFIGCSADTESPLPEDRIWSVQHSVNRAHTLICAKLVQSIGSRFAVMAVMLT